MQHKKLNTNQIISLRHRTLQILYDIVFSMFASTLKSLHITNKNIMSC